MAKLVEKRYAAALFDMAAETSALDMYESEVKTVLEGIKEAPDFTAVLKNSKISIEEKISLVERIFTDKIESPIVGLMVLLIKKGRQNDILEVLNAFLEMVNHHRGIVKATVTSAVPLKDKQLEEIKAKLEAGTKNKIELETIIDTNIIAGLIIRVGDKVVDASVKHKMQTLKKQLSDIRLA